MKKKIFICLLIVLAHITTFAQEMGSFKDSRDGKIYKTVQIGDQIWMAENLAYKANTGCLAYNNDIGNVDKYGYLYSWNTACSVCPKGWHLSSLEEWEIMNKFICIKEGLQDRETEFPIAPFISTKYDWITRTPLNNNNSYNFFVLPAGFYHHTSYPDKFSMIGKETQFWTSTLGTNMPVTIKIMYGVAILKITGYIGVYDYNNSYYSIRCIKNNQ
jgi:uncharacterized protein (TIGR02145 family)